MADEIEGPDNGDEKYNDDAEKSEENPHPHVDNDEAGIDEEEDLGEEENPDDVEPDDFEGGGLEVQP